MAEAKSRREPNSTRTRVRPKPEAAVNGDEDLRRPDPADADLDPAEAAGEVAEATTRRDFSGDDYASLDDEVNNRYEEIKRGSTHISELQQMTMPQLLKIAKEEGLTDYTGLK